LVCSVRELGCDLDPLPAFGGDPLRLGLELRGGQAVEQRDLLEPAAVVLLEKIAQNATGSRSQAPRPTNTDRLAEAPTIFSVSMRRICQGSFDQEAEMVSQTCSWRACSELTVKSTRHWRTAGAASPQ
jgi:hypothetical protein